MRATEQLIPFQGIASHFGWSVVDLPPATVVRQFSIAHDIPLDMLMIFCVEHTPVTAQCYLDTFRTDLTGVDAMRALREHAAASAVPDATAMDLSNNNAAPDPSPELDSAARQGL